jgi:hypothetical protein
MNTGALQHLLLRLRRWYIVRSLRTRHAQLTLLVDTLSADVAQDMMILIDLRQELQHVTRQLRLIERGTASAHEPIAAEA